MPNRMSGHFRSAHWLPAIVLIAGLALSVWGYFQGRQYAADSHRARLRRETVAVVERLTISQRVYQDVSQLMVSYLAEQPVTGERWLAFQRQFEWRTMVPRWMDVGWVEINQNPGSTNFRAEVKWVESRGLKSRFVPGFDLTSVAELAQLEALARTSSNGVSSEPQNLNRDGVPGIWGNIVLHPVRTRSVGATSELKGYLLLTYDPLASVDWSLQPSMKRVVDVRFLPRMVRPLELFMDGYRPVVGSTFFGTTNHYFISPTRAFYDESLAYFPEIVLFGGGICTALLAGILWTQIRRRIEAERISVEIRGHAESLRISEENVRVLNRDLEHRVEERTTELMGTNRQLQTEIAARLRAESDLLGALATEKELHELKSNFVAIVSHEFRTPLANIRSSAELLSDYADRLPPERRTRLLQHITQCSQDMAQMMEEVLLLSRIESSKIKCERHEVDLVAVCQRLIEETTAATSHRCPVEFRIESSMELAYADESILRHTLGNLLTNAIKYSAPGSTVAFTACRNGEWAVFSIADHGIGIADTDQARLFEAFQRGANVGKVPGTGLGLVIVKRCVELQGGMLEFQSSVGQGTTFSVSLPLFRDPGHTTVILIPS